MFTSRLLTGIISVVLLAAVLLLGTATLKIAAFAITVIILYELFKATGMIKKGFLFIIGFLPAATLFLQDSNVIKLIIFVYIILLFAFMLLCHRRIKFSDVCMVFMIGIMITFFMYHLILIRQIPDVGRYVIWAVFVGACMSDTCAYISGMLFGKHKLAPEISPKKTIEGSVGAIVGTVISMLIYGAVVRFGFGCSVNFAMLIPLGILCSLFGQMGDLAASIIKRQYGIKDFGTIFPGHGGMLDRFDSILFVTPIVYFFAAMLNVITL